MPALRLFVSRAADVGRGLLYKPLGHRADLHLQDWQVDLET